MLHTQLCFYEYQGTYIYKNISLILFSKGAHRLLLVWEIDGETYTQRRDFFLSHIFFREPGSANACTHFASHIVRDIRDASDRLRVPGSTLDSLAGQSKSDRVVLISRGLLPAYLDALPSPCLLITTWQLVKVHGVTRNEPKIHVISYITLSHSIMETSSLCG